MATSTIKINRKVEHIEVRDEDGEVAYRWAVRTDDASMERMMHMVGDAMERFSVLSDELGAAEDEEGRKKATDSMVRLFRRCTVAVIGEQGWHDVLEFIGDGEEADPAENIGNLGEVFAALANWLWEHCSNKQLREAGAYFAGQERQMRAVPKPKRPKRKRKAK